MAGGLKQRRLIWWWTICAVACVLDVVMRGVIGLHSTGMARIHGRGMTGLHCEHHGGC
jgi:hypothetical protein